VRGGEVARTEAEATWPRRGGRSGRMIKTCSTFSPIDEFRDTSSAGTRRGFTNRASKQSENFGSAYAQVLKNIASTSVNYSASW